MAYKEIQVPDGTVRTIYEDFLKQVKPLAEQQELKNTEQEAINKAHRVNEKKLKAQYKLLAGATYNPYITDSCGIYSFGISYTAIEALRDVEKMLNAVRFSDGDLTMTVQQVEEMEDVRTGNLLEYIKKDVAKPVRQPPSFWQKHIDRLHAEKAKKALASEVVTSTLTIIEAPTKSDPEQESCSFAQSFMVIALLAAVVVTLIKACGG